MYGLKSINTGGNYKYTNCAIPSDSYWEHKDITLVNVHVGLFSGSVYARICAHAPMTNAVNCGSWKSTSTAGERTLSFSSSAGELNILTDYQFDNPFVEVTTNGDGNYIRGVYVAN
jgi:hypothetical protein